MRVLLLLLAVPVVIVAASKNTTITFPKEAKEDNIVVKETLKETENTSLKETAHHVANIGLKTLRDLVSGHSNVILSPLNVYSCLGILTLGAAGESKEEIRRILGPQNHGPSISEIVTARGGVSFASALFLDKSFVPKPEFTIAALSEYQASVLSINASDGEEAKKFINRWVAVHTNETIPELLQGHFDPNTRMVVVSALLFNGKWMHSFPHAGTTLGKFEIEEGSSVDVPLMHLLASVPVLRNLHFDAISLPYEDGGMVMHMILPKEHGLPALKKLLSHFNSNSLKKLRKDCVTEEIFMVVPKLNINGKFSLTDSLRRQGVESIFNPAKANFTNLLEEGSGLFVSQIYHSIHFQMNEEGTIASAATAAILTKSSKFIFRANRPFIFFLTDEEDLVLFMGVVVKPE